MLDHIPLHFPQNKYYFVRAVRKIRMNLQDVGRARSLVEEERDEIIASSLRCGCIGSSTGVPAGFNQARRAEDHEILPSQDASPT